MEIIGQNGAGKTTLIKLMLNLINKDNGKVKIFNNITIYDAKEDIGTVLDYSFFPEILKIKDIDLILKNIYKNYDQKLFNKYLTLFKLKNNSLIKELSTGMKKKLEIACALSHKQKLLILDEQTSMNKYFFKIVR